MIETTRVVSSSTITKPMCVLASNLDIPGDLEIRFNLASADDLDIRYDLAFADDWSVPPVACSDVQSS
jgi:hypothetical protein